MILNYLLRYPDTGTYNDSKVLANKGPSGKGGCCRSDESKYRSLVCLEMGLVSQEKIDNKINLIKLCK